jgi:hypothetical protein
MIATFTITLFVTVAFLHLPRVMENEMIEIEDTRIYGRRLLLSDIYNDSLKWKPFNGSWINGELGKQMS